MSRRSWSVLSAAALLLVPVAALAPAGAAAAASVQPCVSTYTSSTPLAIPDDNPGGVTRTFHPDDRRIAGIAVRVDITHSFDGDLDVTLEATGTRSGQTFPVTRTISTDNGGSGDNYTSTLFDDAAVTSVAAGTAPFAGTYLPEEAFNDVEYAPGADLTVRVADDSSADVGTWTSGSVTVYYAACGPDSDDDLVLDRVDNCRLVPNADQADLDGDGQGDACDGDRDGDAVLDVVDNCPLVANADQADLDADSNGDACDGDQDGDGLLDVVDSCPRLAAATTSGCPAAARTATLGYRTAKPAGFRGVVSSPAAACRRTKVTLWRVRPGPDLKVGAAGTATNGAFAVAKPLVAGRYYLTAPAVVVPGAAACAALASPPRRLG